MAGIADPATLRQVLAHGRDRGFLGPGPLEDQIEHARGFARVVGAPPEAFLDLGAGGGLPGLVLAVEWPATRAVLVEAMERRALFLRDACAQLGFEGRVRVVGERAEVAARRAELRGQFPVVTARSFGPPAVTAECGGAFLRVGGRLVVSEPPSDRDRWPAEGLARLGLVDGGRVALAARYAVLERTEQLDDRWPRRTGIPMKRPLWR